MAPALADGGGLLLLPPLGENPKLPKVLELAAGGERVSLTSGGKDEAVGLAKVSFSSSSATLWISLDFALPPKGLLPGNVDPAMLPLLDEPEWPCPRRNSARCDSKRRWKKLAQNWRMSVGCCLRISLSRREISLR